MSPVAPPPTTPVPCRPRLQSLPNPPAPRPSNSGFLPWLLRKRRPLPCICALICIRDLDCCFGEVVSTPQLVGTVGLKSCTTYEVLPGWLHRLGSLVLSVPTASPRIQGCPCFWNSSKWFPLSLADRLAWGWDCPDNLMWLSWYPDWLPYLCPPALVPSALSSGPFQEPWVTAI